MKGDSTKGVDSICLAFLELIIYWFGDYQVDVIMVYQLLSKLPKWSVHLITSAVLAGFLKAEKFKDPLNMTALVLVPAYIGEWYLGCFWGFLISS